MNSHIASSPVSLSYVAALRGIKPRLPGENFVYIDLLCQDSGLLTCLAASNAEGEFFGVIADEEVCRQAQMQAASRGVTNVAFVAGMPGQILANNLNGLPMCDYAVCDESVKSLPESERKAIFDLAEKKLKAGGLFNYTYRAYEKADGHLRFLVSEFAPEMNAKQAEVFLHEIKKLGGTFLTAHPDVLAKLNEAISKNIPDAFFSSYEDNAKSGAFDTIVALRPRGFAYTGDSNLASNYVELSLPPEAQQLAIDFRDNHLYEPIKDFALDRMIRSDIWCRMPAVQTSEMAELFGGFVYGITTPREAIPAKIEVKGKSIDLSSDIYTKLIDLLALIPASIGDFLGYPAGGTFEPRDVVGAIQILVACGIAQPMRGIYHAANIEDINQPRLAGAFNRYLDQTQLGSTETWMASPVLGTAVAVPVREALVMQALNRVGLADSVSALLPELERLARTPSHAARAMDVAEPTAETAHNMIEDVVGKSIVQWYAYGLLEAA